MPLSVELALLIVVSLVLLWLVTEGRRRDDV